ncbi:MAG: hypothetical protein A4S09_15025 [Proteobacteria bacterium SG_bin7]|nr:MAG: hypothetical protein A4S09_15025 [Proteobacteria bacterium SG_bin7]
MTTTSAQIEYFRREAKKLFKLVLADNPEAKERVLNVLKCANDITLMRVQHTIAVESGFLNWADLIKASELELRRAVTRSKNRTASPLGIFYRGTGIIPATPENEKLADMFDKMTPREQERFLDDGARRMGMFDR